MHNSILHSWLKFLSPRTNFFVFLTLISILVQASRADCRWIQTLIQQAPVISQSENSKGPALSDPLQSECSLFHL